MCVDTPILDTLRLSVTDRDGVSSPQMNYADLPVNDLVPALYPRPGAGADSRTAARARGGTASGSRGPVPRRPECRTSLTCRQSLWRAVPELSGTPSIGAGAATQGPAGPSLEGHQSLAKYADGTLSSESLAGTAMRLI